MKAGVPQMPRHESLCHDLKYQPDRLGLDAAKAEDMQPTVRALREIRL